MSRQQLKLKPTQRLLWQCITAPDEERHRLKKSTILPIRGDRRLSAFARVDIYARMYFWRIVDSLKEDFPSLWELMTEDEFHSLMRAYLTRHPSSHWTLRDAGQHLPPFLKKQAILKKWPFLVDLARFEWAMIEAFDAADGTLLQAERLKALPPQDWSSLQLPLIPAHRLLRCRWPIHKIRESILATGSWSGAPETTFLQVWRKGTLSKEQTVFYRPVDGVEFRLLRSLRQGGDFASLCQKLVDQVGEAQAPQRAVGYLQSWLQDKIL